MHAVLSTKKRYCIYLTIAGGFPNASNSKCVNQSRVNITGVILSFLFQILDKQTIRA